jgi:type IV secretion system protein VirB10
VIDEGTVIPAVLTRRISTDAPGVVTAMVNMDVYDSRTARTLLLPKGARLVGRYNGDVAAGQERIQFAFTRLILPDGASFDLPGVVGSDAAGQGGVEADVDRHFLRTFGAALLIGVLADHFVRPEAAPAPGVMGGGLSATGQVLVDTANAALQRNAAIVPTLTLGEGTRLNVEVVRDMVFSHAYRMPS